MGGETEPANGPARRREAILGWLAAGLIRLLRASLRLRFHRAETVRSWEGGRVRFILAFWHRHILLMPYAYRGRGISVLVSRSKDGEIIARAVARMGIRTARGSSSRSGAMGLHALLRQARSGLDIAFTPDGPRGPAGVVQEGVIAAAQLTGWPIVPVAWAARRGWRLRSWDGTCVPKPGTRVHFVFEEPLRVERGADVVEAAEALRVRLEAASEQARSLAGVKGSLG